MPFASKVSGWRHSFHKDQFCWFFEDVKVARWKGFTVEFIQVKTTVSCVHAPSLFVKKKQKTNNIKHNVTFVSVDRQKFRLISPLALGCLARSPFILTHAAHCFQE